ncbi:MAG: nuclear transport factor 2 family protein [Alphaproteobacteria bacterium]|nr:nuclear transport factor 2 family protein [Alphaproteobacteria bacterium]
MSDSTEAQIRHIYEEWHAGTNSHDVARVMALYAERATLETPAFLAIYPHSNDGLLRGRSEIEKFFTKALGVLSNEFRELYRSGVFLSTGKLLTWEYPRKTPTGEQVDLVESMDIEDGLIVYHRVYWGWKGFQALMAAGKRHNP